MHPAPSLIVFTVFSGLGFGLLAWLGLGPVMGNMGLLSNQPAPLGWAAVGWFGLGYGLVGAGLLASAFHLGHPERMLLAFSQWRSSWLSREAVLAAATLLVMAPHAAGSEFLAVPLPALGALGGVLSLLSVAATSMIYAQLRSVPRWNHWTVPVLFLAAALAGGALLAGQARAAMWCLLGLGLVMGTHWRLGDMRLGGSGSHAGTATGLGHLGKVRLLEPPHSGRNYLLREMVHVIGRRHARKLRQVALGAGVVVPASIVLLAPGSWPLLVIAALFHLGGMLAARWLFFAEAEHVVGFYYGREAGAGR